MRRITITLSAVALLLAFGSTSALARHGHHRRDARHHRHHARIEHFGDVGSSPGVANSAANAGIVRSFSGGRLTILLNDGSTVSGAISNDTELDCMAAEQDQTMHEDGDGGDSQSGDTTSGNDGSGGDDQSQPSGGQSSGEDQGDAAEPTEDQAEDQNENEMQNNCSTSSLAPGTAVHEAELRLSSAGDSWKKVELGS